MSDSFVTGSGKRNSASLLRLAPITALVMAVCALPVAQTVIAADNAAYQDQKANAGNADERAKAKDASRHEDGKPGLMTSAMRSEMPDGMQRASKLIGRNVKDKKGESIGEIKDLALDPHGGNVRYAVLSFGGVMGVGDKLFAVPLSAFERGKGDDIVLNVSKESLKSKQGFNEDNWPMNATGSWTLGKAEANAGSPAPSAGTLVKAKKYIGSEVKGSRGDELGNIKDLAINLENSTIAYAVVEHGGVLGIGEKLVAVPTKQLSAGLEDDEFILNVTEDELDNARGFADDNWPVAAVSIAELQYDTDTPDTAKGKSAKRGEADMRFSKLDKDADGYVSRDEVKGEPSLQSRYQKLDKDNDGKLDKAEFAQFEIMDERKSQR